MMSDVKVVILAGGKGKRLAPHTAILPKPLLPIGEKPILEIVITQLAHQGFKKIILAVGYQSSLIETYFGDGKRWGIQISYSREKEPLGTAAPISLIEELESPFLVLNSDILSDINYPALLDFHKANKAFATIALFRKDLKIDLGVIEAEEDGIIKNYIEKPVVPYEVSMGIYVFEPRVKEYIIKNEKMDIPDLIKKIIHNKKKVIGYRHTGLWLDIGRVEDYQEAVEIFNASPKRFLK